MRGVEPPLRGTLSERVIIEMISRERWQSLAMWEISTMATGILNGVKPEAVKELIKILREDLAKHMFHTMYDTKVYVQRMRQELDEARGERQRLARLDAMTVK